MKILTSKTDILLRHLKWPLHALAVAAIILSLISCEEIMDISMSGDATKTWWLKVP